MGAVLVITPALLQIPLYCRQGPLSGGAGPKRTAGWKGQCNGFLGTESYNPVCVIQRIINDLRNIQVGTEIQYRLN